MHTGYLVRQSIDLAITTTQLMMEQASQWNINMDKMNFLREFCTAELSFPRRSGKTSSLIKVVNERFTNAIVIGFNQGMCKLLREGIKGNKVLSAGQSLIGHIDDDTEAILIDEGQMYKKYRELYIQLASRKNDILVFSIGSPNYILESVGV